jgi:16S rRNA (adenine1518-N6/adenine1519-N6)-dimethyltransferase
MRASGKLDLRKTSPPPDPASTNSGDIFSDGGDHVGSPGSRKWFLDGDSGSGVVGILRKSSKSLGQHWLHDQASLTAMCDAANIGSGDTVLEIGPGLGTLTIELTKRAKRVIAVEFDRALAAELPMRVPAQNLEVINQDILKFNLSNLPRGYKVAANLPYYITSKIVRMFLESVNPPKQMALLVQKEVAQRMAARPGNMSILGVSVQYYSKPSLGPIVPAELFTPAPKVDSQIIAMAYRNKPLYPDIPASDFFRVVRAGFGEKRKTLRNSLSGGLYLEKDAVVQLLNAAKVDPRARAEQLSLDDWHNLARSFLKL